MAINYHRNPNLGGRVPADHPRRCTGRCKTRGERCWQYGLVGTEPPLCPYHGGVQRRRAQAGTYQIITRNLPIVYKRHLGPKLSEAVHEALGVDPDEQIALYHELALMREYAGTYVGLYSAVLEADMPQADKANKLLATGMAMRDALEGVASICEKAGRIAEKSKDRFSIHDLKFVIDKIMMIHYKVCGDQPDLVRRFADAIDQQLTLPGKASEQGTDLHPDQTAAAFDASVPSKP